MLIHANASWHIVKLFYIINPIYFPKIGNILAKVFFVT